MSVNPFYNPTGNPTFGGPGSSATIRAEFALVAAGFDKMPPLPLTAGAALIVNGAGTGFTITGGLSLSGTFATTGNFTTTLVQAADVNLTLPLVDGTLATLAGIETLSNKTFVSPALGTPSSGVATNLTGTAAGLTAGSVITNANLSGVILSSGNVTSTALQTGSGSTFVMQASPTLTTPVLGVATATSINGIGIAGTNGKTVTVSASLTLAGTDLKTLTVSASLQLTGTDGSSVAFGTGGTVLYSGGALGTPSSGTLTNATGLPAASVVAGALANGMTATTQAALDASTKIATTAYVDAAGWSAFYNQTVSAQSVVDITGIPSSVNNLHLVLALLPGTVSSQIFVQFFSGTGAPDTGSHYYWDLLSFNTSSSIVGANPTTGIVLTAALGTSSNTRGSINMWINGIQSSAVQANWLSNYLLNDNVTPTGSWGFGAYGPSFGPITGLRVTTTAGTFSGRITLYTSR